MHSVKEWDAKIRHQANRASLAREPHRVMYPGELMSLIQRHLHPRWISVWAYADRWGARNRDHVGVSPHATLRFAGTNDTEYTDVCILPVDCLPYYPLLPRWMLDDLHDSAVGYVGDWTRTKDIDKTRWPSSPVVGWRRILEDLVAGGFLRPSGRLSRLIGTDTYYLSLAKGWR
jgi:hypothetical protein